LIVVSKLGRGGGGGRTTKGGKKRFGHKGEQRGLAFWVRRRHIVDCGRFSRRLVRGAVTRETSLLLAYPKKKGGIIHPKRPRYSRPLVVWEEVRRGNRRKPDWTLRGKKPAKTEINRGREPQIKSEMERRYQGHLCTPA